MGKICHYILTHFDKEGILYFNRGLLNPEGMMDNSILVINNVSRVSKERLNEFMDSIDPRVRIKLIDIDSVSQARNEIIKDFRKNSIYEYFTMIDADDTITKDYHKVLSTYCSEITDFGIFGGVWVYPDGKTQVILNRENPSKYIKYASHYTNWLYLYSKKFAEIMEYPDAPGYSFPEDEYLYSFLSSYASDRNLIIPVIDKDLYLYHEGNSKVAKMDTDIEKILADYLSKRKLMNYKIITDHEVK